MILCGHYDRAFRPSSKAASFTSAKVFTKPAKGSTFVGQGLRPIPSFMIRRLLSRWFADILARLTINSKVAALDRLEPTIHSASHSPRIAASIIIRIMKLAGSLKNAQLIEELTFQ